MKLNLGSGPNPLDGFENLDPNPDYLIDDRATWSFEQSLPYPDASIEGISISHALMYVALIDWPAAFNEIARVLQPGGIVRITEDATDDPESERYGGWSDAVTLTSLELVRSHLRQVGLRTRAYTSSTSGFADLSLCQAWHGEAPKVFWIEGRKP